jgi:hypothetical protein
MSRSYTAFVACSGVVLDSVKLKVKQSRYTPRRRLGGEEV